VSADYESEFPSSLRRDTARIDRFRGAHRGRGWAKPINQTESDGDSEYY
jgi:hypothetical protein